MIEANIHKVSFDKIWSAENGYSDENMGRFLIDRVCVGIGNVIEYWCQVFPDAYKVGALPWIVRKLSCWFIFAAQFTNSWQPTNFVCIRKHLTSIFNHISNPNTNTVNQKTTHILITVSLPISIFSRSNFVKRHFMIKSFWIFASIIFSIFYDNIMTIVLSYTKFLFFIYN